MHGECITGRQLRGEYLANYHSRGSNRICILYGLLPELESLRIAFLFDLLWSALQASTLQSYTIPNIVSL
ncbi:hypothetical protein PIIN_11325 [Serendipita indica DSM 11827]|uniref:Uncharacterized protein n=1 Tax=Serendipita indica (strain DSM 11827) TaxID=1109443 RepID=G4U1A5_SERID|nr:hypothetical protein PIIN_11325 [Serendipita indica DSM 11827]